METIKDRSKRLMALITPAKTEEVDKVVEESVKKKPITSKLTGLFKKNGSKECLDSMTAILKEYGIESNIPVSHEYWEIRNRFRALLRKDSE